MGRVAPDTEAYRAGSNLEDHTMQLFFAYFIYQGVNALFTLISLVLSLVFDPFST